MNKTILERETIDERLQRRSRRAHGTGHVHLPCAPLIEIVGRTDACQHVAALIVHGDDGDGNIRTQCDGAVARERLDHFLQTGIQRQCDDVGIFQGGDGLIGGMGRKYWHRLAQPRHRRSFCLKRIFHRHAAVFHHALENAVTRRARYFRVAIEPAGFRRLRQGDQKRRFR